jgi:hypothetical protein
MKALKLIRRPRYLLSVLLAAAFAGVLVVQALADAPDPKIPPQTPSTSVVSVTHDDKGTADESDDTTTVTIKGGWVWTTHNKDCNLDRAGAGFSVDWNDPDDPGFHITTLNGDSIDVGSSLAVNGNTVDNVVHPTPGAAQLGGAGKETDVANPSQYQLWRGGCGTFTYVDPATGRDSEGIWGPRSHVLDASGADTGAQTGISHTYKDTTVAQTGIKMCVVMHDVHSGTSASNGGGVGIPKDAREITAGGSGRNPDNGAEKNSGTPLGNACIPIVIPTITTNASPDTSLGSSISDTATLTGAASNAAGSITFEAFGPDDANCSGAVAFTSTKTVSGNGSYTSDPFTPTAAGTYRWIASYSGDANTGTAATSTECNDPNESNKVKGRSSIATRPSLIPNDTATITGFNPTGSVTFKLFPPSDTSCSGTPAYSQTVSLSGGQASTSNTSFVASTSGTWRWLVQYTGDSNNQPSTSACGVERFTIVSGP